MSDEKNENFDSPQDNNPLVSESNLNDQTGPNPIVEELTAYLDGELEPGDMARVEERLQKDDEYRRELQRLQKAWDLLDQLPRAYSSPQFTKSTIEMIVLNETEEVRRQKNRLMGWLGKIALFIGLPLVAFGASHVVTRQVQQKSNRQLLADLDVINNIVIYEKIQNVDFLKQLESAGIFSEYAPPSSVLRTRDAHSITSLKQVEELSLTSRDELRRKRKKFLEYSTEKQTAVRKLHSEIDEHENASALRQTMVRYFDWLSSLRESELDELRELDESERVNTIAAWVNRERLNQIGTSLETRLPDQDFDALDSWMSQVQSEKYKLLNQHIFENRAEYSGLIQAPSDHWTESNQRELSFLKVIERHPDVVGRLISDRIGQLRDGLDMAGLEIFDRHAGADRERLVLNWMKSVIKRNLQLAGDRSDDSVQIAQLKWFFNNVLNEEDRKRLTMQEGQNPEDFLKSLRTEYRKFRNDERKLDNNPTRKRIRPQPSSPAESTLGI